MGIIINLILTIVNYSKKTVEPSSTGRKQKPRSDIGVKRLRKIVRIKKTDGSRMYRVKGIWKDLPEDNVSIIMVVFILLIVVIAITL